MILVNFVKNCMKLRKFWAAGDTPLNPPLATVWGTDKLNFTEQLGKRSEQRLSNMNFPRLCPSQARPADHVRALFAVERIVTAS